jgi:hypothetical protein
MALQGLRTGLSLSSLMQGLRTGLSLSSLRCELSLAEQLFAVGPQTTLGWDGNEDRAFLGDRGRPPVRGIILLRDSKDVRELTSLALGGAGRIRCTAQVGGKV